MTKTQFTPGPWSVFYTKSGQTVIGVGQEKTGDGITDHNFALWQSGKIRKANANLIAAAPDLYDALDGMTKAYKALCELTDVDYHKLKGTRCERALTALAKARGES